MSPGGGLQGDEGELFELYAERLRRVTGMAVNTSPDIVEEACAQTFAQLLISQPRRETVWPWMKTVARREAIRLDRRARAPLPLARPGEYPDAGVDFDVPDPKSSGAVVDAMLDAKARLGRLNPREREAVVLKALGWKYHEIAKDLGVSPSRVEQIVTRASGKLRRIEERERPLDNPRAEHLRELEERPPRYLLNSIGRPPRSGPKYGGEKLRLAWRRLALAIDDYRSAHGVVDTGRPLGRRPPGGEQRAVHDQLGSRIAAYALERGLDLPRER